MRGLTAAAFVTAIVCALDCSSSSGQGGGSICDYRGLCANSPPPTAANIALCQRAVGDPKCGGQFQVYFNCAAGQEKCTPAGLTDDDATRSAIMANCSTEVAAYQSCTGNSTTAMCGLVGIACCTDGSPPCAPTACCDPGTGKCRGMGEACTAAGTVCGGNQCTACGAPGQPCCSIFGMTQPAPCPSGGCCNYSAGQMGGSCIAEGGQCEAPSATSTETVCRMGSCITCGGSFGSCCAGNKCKETSAVCSAGTCMP